MSNYGGKYSKFDTDLRKRYAQISDKLDKASDKIKDILETAIRSGNTSTSYWNGVRAAIDTEYATLQTTFAGWSRKEIPAAYQRQIYEIDKKLRATKKVVSEARKSATKVINSNASKQLMTALAEDAFSSFSAALAAGKENVYRITRATQQELIKESLIDNTISDVYIDTGDLRKAAEALKDKLIKNMIIQGKQFVQAGRYKYDPEYYAEMVARVKFHEAQSYAARVQASNYGTDLIQISSHNTTTPLCQPYEGKIFSLSGQDKRFPAADASTPYHPNCLHLEFPVFIESLELTGQLESFSAFSLDKIDRPPVPAGFVPISQRGIA